MIQGSNIRSEFGLKNARTTKKWLQLGLGQLSPSCVGATLVETRWRMTPQEVVLGSRDRPISRKKAPARGDIGGHGAGATRGRPWGRASGKLGNCRNVPVFFAKSKCVDQPQGRDLSRTHEPLWHPECPVRCEGHRCKLIMMDRSRAESLDGQSCNSERRGDPLRCETKASALSNSYEGPDPGATPSGLRADIARRRCSI
jgi:hypothetical protein